MYEAVDDPNNTENKIDIRNEVVIEKLKETNRKRYDEIYAVAKERIDESFARRTKDEKS
ncbi:MAG: hypothetical protein MZV65_45010 [Chromatiales bacterium]|nr:hypothetical protein [Chromatiales bacterium]